ncbi:hypothetical protein KJ912_04410, partial [Patescibacteria group bacterium]|nr:hypothetical protein [Patescibacteria group bacterium]
MTDQDQKQTILNIAQKAWQEQNAQNALDILDQLKNQEITQLFDQQWIQGLKTRMLWVAFPSLPQEKQLALIRENLLIPLKDPQFNLQSIFRVTRFLTPAYIWPDEVPKYLEAFLNNQESLGAQPITTQNKGQQEPTLGNWLRDYSAEHGLDKLNKTAAKNYVMSSPNTSTLASQDKITLEKLVVLFESIKVFTLKQIKDEVERQQKKDEARQPQVVNQTPVTAAAASAPVSVNQPPSTAPDLQQNKNILTSPKNLKTALQENPKIANQKITSHPLDILGRGNNIPPTVQNWLLDYRSRHGTTGHTQEDRGEYLLKSPNVSKLSSREKINIQRL